MFFEYLTVILAISIANASVVNWPRDTASSSSNCQTYSNSLKKDFVGVCVCSKDACHQLGIEELEGSISYTTSKSGRSWDRSVLPITYKTPNLIVDPSKTFQFITGFGGAFTDSAAINLYKLRDPKLQDDLLDAYFSSTGAHYSLGRVPIASTDFSPFVYSYNDEKDDLMQTNFSIAIDRDKKIPFIKRALQRAPNMTLFASSWAPPAWMTLENTTIDTTLQGEPGSSYWKSYALYLSKFHQAYGQEGIFFPFQTTQNEPVKPSFITKLPGFHHWQSMRLTAEQESNFIKKDLGPQFQKDGVAVKMLIFDDQKSGLSGFHQSLDDPETSQYVAGTAVHWYSNIDFVVPHFGRGGNGDKLYERHQRYPEKFILATEACEGYLPPFLGTGAGTALNDAAKRWKRAENYARDIIVDMQNWVVGWTDWNLVLGEDGGPNWAENKVDSPIIVTDDGLEFLQQPMYYILAHFSKFLQNGSVRISLEGGAENAVAFKNTLGQIVVVLQNRFHYPQTFLLGMKESDHSYEIFLEANSVKTVVFNKN